MIGYWAESSAESYLQAPMGSNNESDKESVHMDDHVTCESVQYPIWLHHLGVTVQVLVVVVVVVENDADCF